MSIFYKKFPNFSLDNIHLREIDPNNDAKDYLAYITNPEIARYLDDLDIPNNMSDSYHELTYWHKLFYNKQGIYWAITNEEDKMIGSCGFHAWNQVHKRLDISYDLSYDYWGKFIMTTCLEKIINYAYNEMQANRIQATVEVTNERSIKLLERMKFEKEGLLKKYRIKQGNCIDSYIFSYVN